jgi:hypothetical protein
MTSERLHNAIRHAYGELDGPPPASDPQVDELMAACRGLDALTTDLPEAEPPASLRDRVMRAVRMPRRRRRGWMAWAAAAAAVLLVAVLLGRLTRRDAEPPVSQPPKIEAKNPVYDDDELDRQFAAATAMAEEVASDILGGTSWDQRIEQIKQDIESLGSELVDPTLPEAGSRPATLPA